VPCWERPRDGTLSRGIRREPPRSQAPRHSPAPPVDNVDRDVVAPVHRRNP
jgi:hypothetical protein